MLLRKIEQIKGTGAESEAAELAFRWLVLASDGVGYSMHETEVRPNSEIHVRYRHLC